VTDLNGATAEEARKGVITRQHANDTFDIIFEDGSLGAAIPQERLGSLGQCQEEPFSGCFKKCNDASQCEGSAHFADAAEFPCQAFTTIAVTSTNLGEDLLSAGGNMLSVVIDGYSNTVREVRLLDLEELQMELDLSSVPACLLPYRNRAVMVLADAHSGTTRPGNFYDIYVRRDEVCAVGYRGNMCNQCSEGYTQNQHIASECPADSTIIGTIILITVLVAFSGVIYLLIQATVKGCRKEANRFSVILKIFFHTFRFRCLSQRSSRTISRHKTPIYCAVTSKTRTL
jgi:hypothetical protein